MENQISVVIADDERLFREALCLTLQQEASIKVVGEAANGPQTIFIMNDLKPNIILLDAVMPDMDVIEIIPAVRKKSPDTKPLMLTGTQDEAIIFKAMKEGAKGYISKDASISDLIKAIQTVHQGELWLERKLMAKFFEGNTASDFRGEDQGRGTKEGLTPRERDILIYLTRGLTNKEIAQDLFISEKTVKCHLNSIFKKLKVTRRLQAILFAIKQGLD